MRRTNYQAFIKILFVQLACSCAQQGVPTGGEKDSQPPQLLESQPQNRQTLYRGNQVTLVFDEFIQLNNPREQIIIVPPLDKKKLEVTSRKNRFILRFNQALKDSTTYNINFRETIQDITERNPVKNLKLAFSTGPDVDTLSISGTVRRHLTNEPQENCVIALLPWSDTANIFKQTPLYFTLSDKNGVYQLDNIKKGKYLIYTFNDKNKNLIVDSQLETFGFKSQPIELKDNNLTVQLTVLKLDMRPLRLASARPVGNQFIIRFNKGFRDISLQVQDTTLNIFYSQPEPSTISIYRSFDLQDSLQLKISCTDSLQNKVDTAIYLKFSKQGMLPEKFNLQLDKVNYHTQSRLLTAEIRFNKPVVKSLADSIIVYADTLHAISFSQTDFTWNKTHTQTSITKTLETPLNFEITPRQRRKQKTDLSQKDKTKEPDYRQLINHLILKRATFISAENDSSTATFASIKKITPEDQATILYNVDSETIALVEAYTKNQVMATSKTKTGRFSNLPPDTYRLRAYIDTNQNGVWDWGNFYLRQEPEPVWFYYENNTADIPAKANWEIGPLWIKQPEPVNKPTQ